MKRNDYTPWPCPPVNRLWTTDDLAAYSGFASVDELIARNPTFPPPLELKMQGRRWRPADVIAWFDALSSAVPAADVIDMPPSAPIYDPTALCERLHGQAS
jgi:predicted DNA-binding transcriptional regulator AlpA